MGAFTYRQKRSAEGAPGFFADTLHSLWGISTSYLSIRAGADTDRKTKQGDTERATRDMVRARV